MFDIMTTIDAEPIIEAGSSAADAIGLALDRAPDQREVDRILTREIPYRTTITRFDRLGRIQCRRPGKEHFDQEPVAVTIDEKVVTQISNSVSATIGGSLSTTVQAGIKASIPGAGEASVSSSSTATIEASRTIARTVQTQLSRSVGVTEKLSVTFHANECFENNNPYGLCLEITVSGRVVFKQNATVERGNDGLFHYRLQNAGTIIGMTIDDVDVSLDPCVRRDEAPRRIADCKPSRRLGSLLPVDRIDGVGHSIGATLKEGGVRTVGELACLDPAREFQGISRRSLQQLRAKAALVVTSLPDIDGVDALADRTVTQILDADPGGLTSALGGRIALADAQRMQADLAGLLVLLNDEVLERATLAELLA